MKFLIITHVVHIKKGNHFFGYRPYIEEMNIWLKNAHDVIVVAPLEMGIVSEIHYSYTSDEVDFRKINTFDMLNWRSRLRVLLVLPKILLIISKAMSQADHIHLRCPGNIGLLACVVQIFFPSKQKTAKYAGNWDPNATQPWSYRAQKWILSNTFLTRNMKVLVYGEWPNQSENIKPFFTATYSESDKKLVNDRLINDTIQLLFVGTLSVGKRPLYALKMAENLSKEGYPVQLKFYGEGPERQAITSYINQHELTTIAYLMGNRSKSEVGEAYRNSHFLLLPSISEGWPKAVAEAMFWGCVPASLPVSCIPFMLDKGERGLLLTGDIEQDVSKVIAIIEDQAGFRKLSEKAMEWSGRYTTEKLESEIKTLLAS